MLINKRYKDIFSQYIHKGEPAPLTIGTLAVCGFCFLLFILVTFSQFNFSHPWFEYIKGQGFSVISKQVSYNPLVPVMIFVIYILSKNYSILLFILYLLIGFFIWPIFVYGGGFEYIKNYLFGYFLGFVFASFVIDNIFRNQTVKSRLLGAFFGVLTIHLCGLFYCIILAIFKVINFSLIIPIVHAMSVTKILYDILFSFILILIAPYIKNVLWVCMKPKSDSKKNKTPKTKKSRRMKPNNLL